MAAATFTLVVMPSSQAGSAVTLDRPRLKGDDVLLTGHAQAGAKVVLTRRTRSGWTRVARTRASSDGRYRTSVSRPTKDWHVSAVAHGTRSEVQTVPATPTDTPTDPPTTTPTETPTATPTETPTATPTETPTTTPTDTPTTTPTDTPTTTPTDTPTTTPTDTPTTTPTDTPTTTPAQTDACGTRPVKADGSLWSCTFNDDFDGTSLDTNKWLVQETSYSGMTTGAHACYLNNPQTLGVSDGRLHLSAHNNLAPFTCKSPYGDFTTTSTAATVASRNSFTQTYGRFEFRAKFPDIGGTPGAHTALWLYPRTHTYGAWPASGEIDVAEWYSALPGNVYPSVHYLGEQAPQSSGLDCAIAGAGSAYHTYAVEWSTTVMRFYYDDQLCWQHAWTPDGMTAPQPFDKPFYFVLTQAFGALWNAPTAATPDDITLDVDWVRAWE